MVDLHAGIKFPARCASLSAANETDIGGGYLSDLPLARTTIDPAGTGNGLSGLWIFLAPFLVVLIVCLRMITAPFLCACARLGNILRFCISLLVVAMMATWVSFIATLFYLRRIFLTVGNAVLSRLDAVLFAPPLLVLSVAVRIGQGPLLGSFGIRNRHSFNVA